MPWGWSTRGQMPTELGGSRGSVEESKVAHAWPKYEAEYLKRRLGGDCDDMRYCVEDMTDDAAKAAYLSKVTENYKQEADECLHAEFTQWLQGMGEYHETSNVYVNDEWGAPIRRHIYRTDLPNDGKTQIGDPMEKTQWDPTWWKKEQLTHLPGVRDYLRANAVKGKKNEFAMNLLAEHGPQNLEQAWMYFKHWVKKRPITDTDCIDQEWEEGLLKDDDDVKRATGNLNHHMGHRPYMGPKPLVSVPAMGSASLAGATAAGVATAGSNPVLGAAAATAAASYFDAAPAAPAEYAFEAVPPPPPPPTVPEYAAPPPPPPPTVPLESDWYSLEPEYASEPAPTVESDDPFDTYTPFEDPSSVAGPSYDNGAGIFEEAPRFQNGVYTGPEAVRPNLTPTVASPPPLSGPGPSSILPIVQLPALG